MLKKFLCAGLSFMMVMGVVTTASAQEPANEEITEEVALAEETETEELLEELVADVEAPTTYAAPGVTVEPNTEFPGTPDAHYQATFTFDASKLEKEVKSIVVGGNMQFYSEDQLAEFEANDAAYTLKGYTAYEYEAGMFSTGYALDNASTGVAYYYYDLVNDGSDMWSVTIPLPGGQYFYDYTITYTDDTTETIKDPANLPFVNNGYDAGHSLFYVGNGDDCIEGEEYVFPRTDGQTGTVTYIDNNDINGDPRTIGVYTPYGYDTTKEYKTLYLCHGGGGNEVEWYHIGSAGNIFDNLIADGELEPTVIVTMNNTVYNFEKGQSVQNITDVIMPLVESKFSVSTKRSDRAICGLSSGASVTVDAMLRANQTFDYYGVFSPSRTMEFVQETLTEEQKEDLKDGALYYVSCGIYDQKVRRTVCPQVFDELTAINANTYYSWKHGAHDWAVWRNQLTDFAKNYLWTVEEYPQGVTVEENTTHPEWKAPYILTFVFEDEDPRDATGVNVYGSFQFFDPAECTEYNAGDTEKSKVPAHDAYNYEDGMFFATNSMIQYEMTETDDDRFEIQIPVNANQHFYRFDVTYDDGETVTGVYDPTNVPFANPLTGKDSGWSLINVGKSGETEGQEYIYPRTDGQTGNVEYFEYTAIDGSKQSFGVYTPYNYDPNKTYKTVYISHGGGGNEVEWFNIGAANNIMDNLVAEGLVQDGYVLVTMDNQILGWQYPLILDNVIDVIIPIVEENYSVSTAAADRAVCGLSSGAMFVNEMSRNYPEAFGYYGAFSGGCQGLEAEKFDVEGMKNAHFYFTSGTIDMALNNNLGISQLDYIATLDTLGIEYEFETLNGSHDWGFWRHALTRFMKDHVFTIDTDKDTFVYGDYTVEKKANGVYHIHDTGTSNPSSMYLIVDGDDALLIDGSNGTSPEQFMRIVDRLVGDRNLEIALTHNHGDHVGLFAGGAYEGYTVYCPKYDYNDSTKETLKNFKVKLVDDGDQIHFGNTTLTVQNLFGHTEGSVVFIDYDHELVYSGDEVGSGFVWQLFVDDALTKYEEGLTNLINNTKKMKNLVILPGHAWQQTLDNQAGIAGPGEVLGKQYLLDQLKVLEAIANGTAILTDYTSVCPYFEDAVEAEVKGVHAAIDTRLCLIEQYKAGKKTEEPTKPAVNTGDATPIVLMSSLMLLSAAAFIALKRKKQVK